MDVDDFLGCVEKFKREREKDPVVTFDDNGLVVLRLFKVEREEQTFREGERIIRDKAVERNGIFEEVIFEKELIPEIEEYISLESFSLQKDLVRFLNLQGIENKYLSMTNRVPKGYDLNDVASLNARLFKDYRCHLNCVKKIKTKAAGIVRDKFSVDTTKSSADVNTSAILNNVGYIISNFEGKYLKLSRKDKEFVKRFIDSQIQLGEYKITIKETLPMYRESVKEIISIGRDLLCLKSSKNKTKIMQFSQKRLGKERKTLESCWQLYFERYLKIFLMSYREFYSQVVFKPMVGNDKEEKPDFLAVDLYNNIDVIEIKNHTTPLLRKEKGRDSYYPSHELNKAVFQLNKYIDLRADNVNLDKINDGFLKALIGNDKLYRPRGILIISSNKYAYASSTDDELTVRLEKEIKKLKTTYENIDIVLFDELIENLENYVEYLEMEFD